MELSRPELASDDRDLVEGLRILVSHKPTNPTLDQVLTVPRTEIGVRLGLRRSRQTLAAYEGALSLCAAATEQRRLGSSVDVGAAERELRAAIDKMHPPRLYEATEDLRAVARAVLANSKSLRLRQARFGVVFAVAEPQDVHRLFILSKLSRQALADTLGIAPRFVRRSSTPSEGVDLRPLPVVEQDLRRAARTAR